MSKQNPYHKLQIAFFVMLLFVTSLAAQSDWSTCKTNSFSCKYQTTSGMLNGKYISFYRNGIKKSEGTFEFNNRIGEWNIWDSMGKLRTTRVYTNPYDYIRTYPPIPSEGPIPLLSKPIYKLTRDSLGECMPFILQARMITYKQRNFKCFYTSDPQLFFNCRTLFNLLYSNALKKHCSIYVSNPKDEDDYSYRFDSVPTDTSKYTLVGFRIKSDWHFDNTRFTSDERPLWITPLVTYKNKPKDTIGLFQVNIPEIRKYLVQVKVSAPNRPDFLQNLDDVFLFGCFNYSKYRKAGVFDDYHIIYSQYSEKSLANCTLNEVETENNLWLLFNK